MVEERTLPQKPCVDGGCDWCWLTGECFREAFKREFHNELRAHAEKFLAKARHV